MVVGGTLRAVKLVETLQIEISHIELAILLQTSRILTEDDKIHQYFCEAEK